MQQRIEFDFGDKSIDDTLKDAPKNAFEPVEPGWYRAILQRIEVRNPQGNDPTTRFNLTFKIIEGKYANRLIFSSVTVKGGTDKQMQWGRVFVGKFAKDGHGFSGDARTFDLAAYLYKEVGIKVFIKKARTNEKTGKTYDAKNEIGEFRPANAVAPGTPPPATWSRPASDAAPQRQTAQVSQEPDDEPDEGPEESTIAKSGKKPWE